LANGNPTAQVAKAVGIASGGETASYDIGGSARKIKRQCDGQADQQFLQYVFLDKKLIQP
jgi:hypothetical protein